MEDTTMPPIPEFLERNPDGSLKTPSPMTVGQDEKVSYVQEVPPEEEQLHNM